MIQRPTWKPAGDCRAIQADKKANAMLNLVRNGCLLVSACQLMLIVSAGSVSAQRDRAQRPPDEGERLTSDQARVAGRFERLELLAGRLAELSRGTHPRRAQLLRELIAASRGRDVAGQFESVVEDLRQERLSSAKDRQVSLEGELNKLLELMLREGRQRQVEAARKRILNYLNELKLVLRQQRGVKARTEGGDDMPTLSKDQQRARTRTEALQGRIKSDESSPSDQSQTPAQSESAENNGEGQKGDAGGEQEGGKGKSDGGGSSPPSDPTQRAVQRLERAVQRMRAAQQSLDEAKRDEAFERQVEALLELEQAKSELEKILRQLREEEMERMLVMLEARIRKMLKSQIKILDETRRLDETASRTEAHDLEIAGGRLGRQERQIVHEAERALTLLREDGTSVAFPETIEQARDDMQDIATRLTSLKFGKITQGLEQDVIEALEEMLAAFQQALKKLRQQQSGPSAGQASPGDQPLVEQLAELRMIRALQQRILRRTQQYGALIEGQQADTHELLEALDRLAKKQEKVFQATHDLQTNRNR